MPEVEFDQAQQFEVAAQRLNYIGDIVATIEIDDYSKMNLENTWSYKLNYDIVDNVEAIKPVIKEKIPQLNWQIEQNLIH